jgi:hypothetical protein
MEWPLGDDSIVMVNQQSRVAGNISKIHMATECSGHHIDFENYRIAGT